MMNMQSWKDKKDTYSNRSSPKMLKNQEGITNLSKEEVEKSRGKEEQPVMATLDMLAKF